MIKMDCPYCHEELSDETYENMEYVDSNCDVTCNYDEYRSVCTNCGKTILIHENYMRIDDSVLKDD